ncbi:unnamed protein product [Eretmochelys imbricata]
MHTVRRACWRCWRACVKSDFACHQLLEQSEEHVESWWFQGQQQHPDFFQWLCCMDMLKVCCPPGTYGPDCLPCAGGHQQPCSGNGKCDGEGTRAGTGLCMCSPGYGGSFCSECADGYYEAARNVSHLVCAECYPACGRCSGPETPAVCAARGAGRCIEHRCIDVDECGTEMAHCRPASSASTPRAPTSAETAPRPVLAAWARGLPVARGATKATSGRSKVPGERGRVCQCAGTCLCGAHEVCENIGWQLPVRVCRGPCAQGWRCAWRTDPQTPRQRAFLTR